MKKEFRDGWLAACTLLGTLVDKGVAAPEAMDTVRSMAGEDPPPRTGGRPPFEWESYVKERHPSLVLVLPEIKDYVAYRKESKMKSWTGRTWRMNLKKWEEWGPQATADALRTSIEHGWTGVFEPRVSPRNSVRRRDAEAKQHLEPRRSPRVL